MGHQKSSQRSWLPNLEWEVSYTRNKNKKGCDRPRAKEQKKTGGKSLAAPVRDVPALYNNKKGEKASQAHQKRLYIFFLSDGRHHIAAHDPSRSVSHRGITRLQLRNHRQTPGCVRGQVHAFLCTQPGAFRPQGEVFLGQFAHAGFIFMFTSRGLAVFGVQLSSARNAQRCALARNRAKRVRVAWA